MKTPWFKRKSYGWGWYPATWQGWLVMAVFVILISLNAFQIDSQSHSVSDTLMNFVFDSFFMTGTLIAICYFTGETPRWQWGETHSTSSGHEENKIGEINEQRHKEKEEAKDKIMKLFDTKFEISNDDVEILAGVSDSSARNYLNELEKEGKIQQNQQTGRGVNYTKIP